MIVMIAFIMRSTATQNALSFHDSFSVAYITSGGVCAEWIY